MENGGGLLLFGRDAGRSFPGIIFCHLKSGPGGHFFGFIGICNFSSQRTDGPDDPWLQIGFFLDERRIAGGKGKVHVIPVNTGVLRNFCLVI